MSRRASAETRNTILTRCFFQYYAALILCYTLTSTPKSVIMPLKPRNTNNSTTLQTRPAPEATSSTQRNLLTPSPPGDATVSIPSAVQTMDTADLLAALRTEMSGLFRAELQVAMSETLSQIKSEMQGLKTELTASMAATRADVSELNQTVTGMEESLSNCTDEVGSLKSKVENLFTKVIALENRCEDLEGRSR